MRLLEDAARESVQLGPIARLLVDRDAADVERAVTLTKAAIAPYASAGGGVALPGAAWIVTARNAPLI